MITDKWIDFYAFVRHSPEDDELKEHIHLYIVPSTLLQTDYITEHLQEYDSTHPDKPLGCIACKSSKFDDWYMYGLHDKAYLASKGQARKHYYVQQDFVVSDEVYFRDEIHQIDRSKYVGMQRLQDAVMDGITFEYMVATGQVPVQLIRQYEYAYNCLCTLRGGRTTHTPKDGEDKK